MRGSGYGDISVCYNTGDVSAQSGYYSSADVSAGGISGYFYNDGIVSDSHSTGSITATLSNYPAFAGDMAEYGTNFGLA